MRFGLSFLICIFAFLQVEAKEALTVESEDISLAVREEFANQGKGEDIELEFFGGQTSFVLENAEAFKIMISELDANEETGKFTAKAEIFADGKPADESKLLGRYFELVKVCVPAREIAKGKIIEAEDLAEVKMRSSRLRADIITAKEDLLGKQAARLIKADKPIDKRDIREEVLITKGQIVHALYRHKGLQITSQAEALEDGAKGQRIRLLNTKSLKEIIGKVLDKNMVKIKVE